MTLTNTIKKAEKLSGVKVYKNGLFYVVIYKGYTVSFAANGREEEGVESTNFYTQRESVTRTEDDRNSDYFHGTFHQNITQCFKFIDRM